MPTSVWPSSRDIHDGAPGIFSNSVAFTSLSSSISCIRRIGRNTPNTTDNVSSFHHALYPLCSWFLLQFNDFFSHDIFVCQWRSMRAFSNVFCEVSRICWKLKYLTIDHMVTTLGSGVSGGSVYVLNLSEPLSFSENSPGLNRRINKVSSCDCTIWTADTGCHGTKAAIG